MSFLMFLVLVVVGFAGWQLWRIAEALIVIAACVGFDEAKKAGVIEEMLGSARQQIADAAAKNRT